MEKKISIWAFISQRLQENVPVMLLYVVESSGSSPGRQGFSMAVDVNGIMHGSIGGGIMEHKLVELAKQKLKEARYKQQASTLKKQIHNKDAPVDQSGMICSGEQTVFMYQPIKTDLPVINQIIQVFRLNHNGTLILSPEGMDFTTSIPNKNFEFNRPSGLQWIYRERIGLTDHLHIIGGGHCALALSKLMCNMDFYIHLYENRTGLHTMEINDAIHEKKIVSEYTQLASLIQDGLQQYVVVMTFGYRTDAEVLRALAEKKFRYAGVLGSKSKIEKLLNDLKNEGISPSFLNSLHAPVGIPIKSETPEEIAVSIAAEIIRERRET